MLCNSIQCGVNAGNYESNLLCSGCGGNVLCELSSVMEGRQNMWQTSGGAIHNRMYTYTR